MTDRRVLLDCNDEHDEIANAVKLLNDSNQTNGTSHHVNNVPTKREQSLESLKDSTCEDIKSQIEQLLQSLTQFNDVRFSAYRTGLKLRHVQKQLSLDQVPIEDLISIFDHHGLRTQSDELIGVPEMTSCLQNIFEGTAIGQSSLLHIPGSIRLCLSWLLNLYDSSSSSGLIRVLAFKVGLVALCHATLEEKYKFLFSLIADRRMRTDARHIGLLIHDVIQIPRLLGEIASFGGSNIEPSVRSCFESGGVLRDEIECKDFLCWLEREPQSLVWLPVMHRLAAGETCRHRVKCNICKTHPINGLRYRCLRCFNFDVCQTCFLTGRFGTKHKIGHPMQEYCSETSAGEDVKDLSRIIRNKFKSKNYFQKHPKMGYLPVQTVLEGDRLESPATPNPVTQCETPSLNTPRSLAQIIAALDLEQVYELEATIQDLEEENRLLVEQYEDLRACLRSLNLQ